MILPVPAFRDHALSLSLRDEFRASDERSGGCAKGLERGFGFGHERGEFLARLGDAVDADKRRLAGGSIFPRGLAEQRGIAFDVQKIVRDLEGAADRAAEMVER